VLSTAGGVIFTGDNEGYFIAVESRTGKELFRYQTGAPIYAPPTSYLFDGRQFVVIPSGSTLTAFALPVAVSTTSSR
jgi:alcohol dehydrogenase (cytochrome c)